jgi:hypothetical protein
MLTRRESDGPTSLSKPAPRMDCRVRPGNDDERIIASSFGPRHCEERQRRSNPDSCAGLLDCFADARDDAQAASSSRRLCVRALPTTTRKNRFAPGTRMSPKSGVRFSDKIVRRKEGGEAPKGACQPLPRNINKRCRSLMLRARQRAISGRARLPALLPRLLPETLTSPTQLQAMLPATWRQAGIARPILSQSSDSTSRLGRSTEGPDAQSRSGADCESARKHRTRSTFSDRIRNASLNERDSMGFISYAGAICQEGSPFGSVLI